MIACFISSVISGGVSSISVAISRTIPPVSELSVVHSLLSRLSRVSELLVGVDGSPASPITPSLILHVFLLDVDTKFKILVCLFFFFNL